MRVEATENDRLKVDKSDGILASPNKQNLIDRERKQTKRNLYFIVEYY